MTGVRDRLAAHLTIRVVLAVGLALIVGFGAVEYVYTTHADQIIREELSAAGRAVTESIRHEMLAGQPSDAGVLFATYTEKPPFELIRLYGPSGVVVHSSRPWEPGSRPFAPQEWATLSSRASSAAAPEIRVGARSAEALIALPNEAACYRCHAKDAAVNGYIGITMSIAPVTTAATRARLTLIATAIVTGLAIVLGLRLVIGRRILRRLDRIGRVIERARRGDLSGRVQDRNPDEIGALGERLNEMLQALSNAERRIAQTSRHAERLATLGEMTAGIVHELKNALGATSAAAQMLLKRSSEDAASRAYIVGIHDQVRRLDHVVRSLVAFSKPASEALRPLDVELAIDIALDLFRSAAGEHAEVRRARQTTLPAIIGQPELLQQVFLNLFLNARDAKPQKLVLTVSAELLAAGRGSADAAPFGPLAGRDVVRVRVTDNGPGLPQAVRERLFEPFHTTKPSGTGLGLSVCERIVRVHGGTIEAASAPDGGTTFTILLPLNGAERPVEDGGRPAAERPAPGGKDAEPPPEIPALELAERYR